VVRGLILVVERLDRVDVEWDRRTRLAEHRRPRLVRAVTDTQLVEDVRVEPTDVGHGEPRVLEILEHLLADIAGEEVLVRPLREEGKAALLGQGGLLDGRREHLVVDEVEVDLRVTDLLLPERHDDEADPRVIDLRRCHAASSTSNGLTPPSRPSRASRAGGDVELGVSLELQDGAAPHPIVRPARPPSTVTCRPPGWLCREPPAPP